MSYSFTQRSYVRSRRARAFRLAAAVLPSLLLAVAAGCDRDPTVTGEDGIRYGAAVALGQGTARTYIVYDHGAPAELGVAISETAMTGLPAGDNHGGGMHDMFNEYLLPLPAGNPTPVKLVELDWNPHGHEPAGIYDKPHFDFHFYSITEAERNSIEPTDPAYAAKAASLPAGDFVPGGYVDQATLIGAPAEAVAVPHMGMHWVDPTSEELHGAPFTKTFIFGSWDGKLIFAEPMITKAYLESKPSFSRTLPMPVRHAERGYYPAGERIYWEPAAKEYRVALSELTLSN